MVQTVITLDVTISGASTNSYLTLAEANSLIQKRPFHGGWDAITSDDEKKAALVWATHILKQMFWNGVITLQTQAQPFPRTGIYDFEGREFSSTAYPEWLLKATSELAFNAATNDLLSDSSTAGFESLKIASLSMKIDTKFKKEVIPEYIYNMIAPWLKYQKHSNVINLGRV